MKFNLRNEKEPTVDFWLEKNDNGAISLYCQKQGEVAQHTILSINVDTGCLHLKDGLPANLGFLINPAYNDRIQLYD